MYRRILITLCVFLMSIGYVFAGGVGISLEDTRKSLEKFSSGKAYISYIDTFLGGVDDTRLSEIHERSKMAYVVYSRKKSPSIRDREITALLDYIYIKSLRELSSRDHDNSITISLQSVKEGDIISVHYEGRLEDGEVFDSSYDRGETLDFTAMAGQMIPGFDAAVLGMKLGDKKTITLSPSDAYGEYDATRTQEIPKTDLQNFIDVGFEFEVGIGLPTQFGELRILEVYEEYIVVDLNHQLAGKTLIFDIELIEIQ